MQTQCKKNTLTYEKLASKIEQLVGKKNIVIVQFGAVWCAPCKTVTASLSSLRKQHAFEHIYIDIDDCQWTTEHSITRVPITLVYEHDHTTPVVQCEGSDVQQIIDFLNLKTRFRVTCELPLCSAAKWV